MWKEMKEATQLQYDLNAAQAELAAKMKLHFANAGVFADFIPGQVIAPEGGMKHDSDKPDLSLISQELMVALARVREFGSKKYKRENWRLGFKYNRSIAAALRHIFAFKDGEDYDQESGVTHIAHAIACLEHLLNDFLYHPHNDDRFRSEATAPSQDGGANE